MHFRRFLPLALAFLSLSSLGLAQQVIPVDKLTLNLHVDHHVYPVYPPIAAEAHIQGTVDIAVLIDVTGKIQSMKLISGPAMLRQAALDALKQWTFHPFVKDGKPVVVSGTASIEFALGGIREPSRSEKKVLQRYLMLTEKCGEAVSARTDGPAAMAVCKQAAETADEFAPDTRFIEKRHVLVLAAWAFLNGGDTKTALRYADQAVEVVKLGHDEIFGSNNAYWVRSIIEAKLGDLTAADQDLTMSEDDERKEIVWAEQVGFESSDPYKRNLAENLRLHAQVFQALKRPDEAQKKLDEAAKYN